MRIRRRLIMFWLLAVSASSFAAIESRDTFALQTELRVSGPTVTIRSPLGLRYRPGYAIPLEVRVHNPGAGFRAELIVSQGSADDGLRCGILEPIDFQPQATRILSFPIIAPPVTADLTLFIRDVDSSGGAGALRFKASLSRALKPMAPEAQLVLTCGNPPNGAPLQDSVRLSAKELPDDAWAYESVDLIVIGDGALREASPQAKAAIRQWLLGGGRIFVASKDAIEAAIATELFPMSGTMRIGADRAWWEKNAGLKQSDVLIESNNRPVYAQLNMGFGHVVFLFPGTRAEEMSTQGMNLFKHPVLQPHREKLPDLRVQPDRYAAFAVGAVSPERRSEALRWGALGALLLCIGLILGFTSRSRWVAAGWPLAITALLAVLLARWMPTRDLAVSRVTIHALSLDGRAIVQREWALIENFQEPIAISASAPDVGNLVPIYADMEELRAAQIDYSIAEQRLRARNVPVLPRQPMLFQGSYFGEAKKEHEWDVNGREGIKLNFPCRALELVQCYAANHKAVWARANGSLAVIQSNGEMDGFEAASFDDWGSVLKRDGKFGDDATLKARATALGWASREALRSGVDTVIAWRSGHSDSDMIEFEGIQAERDGDFQIFTIQARVKE